MGVVNGVAHGKPGDVDYCAGEHCLHLVEDPRQPAERPVEGLQPLEPHVRLTPPSTEGAYARWAVVGGDGGVRAHGEAFDLRDAARKAELVLDILAEGGVAGVAL